MNKPKAAKKLNRVARSRAGGDRSRRSVPKAGSSVTARDESGATKKPKPKWRIRR